MFSKRLSLKNNNNIKKGNVQPHFYLSDQNGDLVGHMSFQDRKIICSPAVLYKELCRT